jgi:ribonuclease HI
MRVTIIADASFDQRYGIGGYGYWIACARGKTPGEGVLRGTVVSSLQAEMMAMCRALHDGVKLRLIEPGDEVLVQTDCQGAIDALEARRLCVPSDKLVLSFFEQLRAKHNLTITFKHVKGHTKLREARFAANRMCDARAKSAMRAERAKRQMPEPRVAWLKA